MHPLFKFKERPQKNGTRKPPVPIISNIKLKNLMFKNNTLLYPYKKKMIYIKNQIQLTISRLLYQAIPCFIGTLFIINKQ
jgi:hypothetical protein